MKLPYNDLVCKAFAWTPLEMSTWHEITWKYYSILAATVYNVNKTKRLIAVIFPGWIKQY